MCDEYEKLMQKPNFAENIIFISFQVSTLHFSKVLLKQRKAKKEKK